MELLDILQFCRIFTVHPSDLECPLMGPQCPLQSGPSTPCRIDRRQTPSIHQQITSIIVLSNCSPLDPQCSPMGSQRSLTGLKSHRAEMFIHLMMNTNENLWTNFVTLSCDDHDQLQRCHHNGAFHTNPPQHTTRAAFVSRRGQNLCPHTFTKLPLFPICDPPQECTRDPT